MTIKWLPRKSSDLTWSPRHLFRSKRVNQVALFRPHGLVCGFVAEEVSELLANEKKDATTELGYEGEGDFEDCKRGMESLRTAVHPPCVWHSRPATGCNVQVSCCCVMHRPRIILLQCGSCFEPTNSHWRLRSLVCWKAQVKWIFIF